MWKWIQAFASPQNFYRISEKIIPWFLYPFIVLTLVGLYWCLVVSPADYQQGDSVRIMYVHVPAAWMSLFIYVNKIRIILMISAQHYYVNKSAKVIYHQNRRLYQYGLNISQSSFQLLDKTQVHN